MPAHKPTPEQVRYLQYFATREETYGTDWRQNPLAVFHAIHPEGTDLSEKQLLWRIKRTFTAMKSQGWITEEHVDHQMEFYTFEETVYRITDRGRAALIEAGASPVTRRYTTARSEPTEAPTTAEAPEPIVLADGPGDGVAVTLPAGRHDRVLFAHRGTDIAYRRSKRPAVDGRAVFVPAP